MTDSLDPTNNNLRNLRLGAHYEDNGKEWWSVYGTIDCSDAHMRDTVKLTGPMSKDEAQQELEKFKVEIAGT